MLSFGIFKNSEGESLLIKRKNLYSGQPDLTLGHTHKRLSHLNLYAGVEQDFVWFTRKPYAWRDGSTKFHWAVHSSFNEAIIKKFSRYTRNYGFYQPVKNWCCKAQDEKHCCEMLFYPSSKPMYFLNLGRWYVPVYILEVDAYGSCFIFWKVDILNCFRIVLRVNRSKIISFHGWIFCCCGKWIVWIHQPWH